MYCINDLRLIMSPDTNIRIWWNSEDKTYNGSLEDLEFTNPLAKASISCMKVFSGVLVFFVNYKQ